MAPPGVVVHERIARWGPRLRQRFARLPIRVRQTNTPASCREALRQAPGSAVVVELSERGAESTLELLGQIRQADAAALAIVVAGGGLEFPEWTARERWMEWIARELGAAHFALEPVPVDHLTQIVLRHLARQAVPMGTSVSAAAREEVGIGSRRREEGHGSEGDS
ncbi:MAG: hypothetical protein HY000_03300 [Planctomycetes bacterium]|nr:hypothetical protein [Planctomycetota bacterium]